VSRSSARPAGSSGPSPRVLLLLSSSSYRADAFLQAAEAARVDVVVGSDHEPALGDLVPDGALRVSFDRVEESVEVIVERARARPFDAVVAAEDPGALLAAAASRALGLPHNPIAAVRAARDKLRTRERLDEAGIPNPRWRALHPDRDVERVARSLRFPVVVKPRSLSAGQGVIRADDPAAFVEAARRAAAIVARADPARTAGIEGPPLLVEEYVPGQEVAVEALLDDGALHLLALFDKPDPMEGPFFDETLLVTPSRKPRELRERIESTVERAADALGLRHGPLHAELRVSEGAVVPLEVAPRTIGGRCSRILSFGTGLSADATCSLEELVLRHAAGLSLPRIEAGEGASGVLMLPVPRRGRFRGIRGEEEARAVPGIEDLEITVPVGSDVWPLPEGNRYLGFLFARGDRPGEVEGALREAFRALEVRIDGG